MFGRPSITALVVLVLCAAHTQAGFEQPDWPDDAGALGLDEWWENDEGDHPSDGSYPPHGGAVPSWLWFFGQGKAGLDGRDGRVGDKGDKGYCGEKGIKGERGPTGFPGMVGMDGDPGENGTDGEMGLKGYKGDMGPQGENATEQGDPPVRLYTRWGRTTCSAGAQLVYSGRAGTSYPSNAGAGANLVCLSDVFNFGSYDNVSQADSTTFASIVGVEYALGSMDPLTANVSNNENVPCAICSVVTSAVYMQPGATTCPNTWEIQYSGYIMSEKQATFTQSRTRERYRSHYVCVDSTAEAVVELGDDVINSPSGEATLAHVSVDCSGNAGSNILDCTAEAYGAGQLSCVVCSKVMGQ